MESQKYPDLDHKFGILLEQKSKWTTVPLPQKIELLNQFLKILPSLQNEYTQLATQNKQTATAHEEWAAFTVPIVRFTRLLISTLDSMYKSEQKTKQIHFQGISSAKKVDDHYVIPVFPFTNWDTMAYPGVNGEIWIQSNHEITQGKEYFDTPNSGRVSLVLGAGNQSSIPVLDILHKLYNCNQVVFLKHNPVNEWLYPIIDKLMAPFISLGIVAHSKGGVPEGQYLINLCDNVHITGSIRSHDIIVWGNNNKEDQDAQPLFSKEITSELGCVTPNIIFPGNYSSSVLSYMVSAIVGATASNCSFNCVSPKLIITQKNWPQREAFLNKIRKAFKKLRTQYPYYPGAKARFASFKETYPQAESYGDIEGEEIPYLFVPNIEPKSGEKAFTTEAWAPVLCETFLDVPTDSFLDSAVQFVNEQVWGNLSCTLFINSTDESSHNVAYKQALKNLRYGTICVNIWSALSYSMATPWGAYPGNTLRETESGIGFVHNPFMLDNIEKTIYKAPLPLMLETKLPWFANSKNSEHFWKTLVGYELNTSVSSTFSLLWNAFLN